MVYSPARWPPYGRPETPRLLKVDHYVLHRRIKMCSCGCAASSQNTDADTEGEGRQEFMGRPNIRGSAGPDLDVGTSRFEGCYLWSGPEVVEITIFGYKVV